MEELIKPLIAGIALGVEAAAALFILVGAVQALYYLALRALIPARSTPMRRKQIWVGFAVWLMLALEFELAADVLRSAISPSWDDIGQLGAIAVIRTFLNYFLEQDIDRYSEENLPSPAAVAVKER